MENATKSQKNMIERIRKYIKENDFYSEEKYEVKEFKVERISDTDTIGVYTSVGLIGDEGTMAQYVARTRRHMFIGPKGGIKCYKYDPKTGKSTTLRGWSKVMIEGYEF